MQNPRPWFGAEARVFYWKLKMHSTTDALEVQEVSLLDSLEREWIKLPLAIMQDV